MTEQPPRSRSQDAPAPGLGRGGRMSRRRKLGAVLRLLRGEDLELVSRALGVTAARLTGWRDDFLAGGEAALGTRERRASATTVTCRSRACGPKSAS